MNKTRFNILFLFSVMVAASLHAQKTWDVNTCITYAIENSLQLKEYEITEKLSLEDFRQSKRDLLPQISASANAGFNYGRSVDPNTNSYVNTEFFNNSYNLSGSLLLFNGFRMQNRIKYQAFRKQASEYNRLSATDDMAFEVMGAYFDVVYYTQMLEIAAEQVEASKLSLRTTEKKVETGLKAKADLLEMHANLEQEELNKIQMKNILETQTLRLKQLMNFVSAEQMELTVDSSFVYFDKELEPEQLFEQYLTWSPYYQSIESDLNMTKKNLSITRSQLYPSLSLNGSLSSGYSETNTVDGKIISFSDQLKNNNNQYIGISLNIPIFNRWQNRSNIKKAKLEVLRAQNNLEKEKQQMFFEMVTNLTELESLCKEYYQYVKRSEVDLLAFRAAEKKFEQGLIDINDYYIAKNRLANTKSQVVRSRTQWEIKMRTIEFYKGRRFWENNN